LLQAELRTPRSYQRDRTVPIGEDGAVSFNRIAWLVTVAAALVTALLLLLSGYNGYGAVAVAVGLSAAINLR